MTRPNYYNENDYSPRLSTEIYALRRNGQLDEARQLAEKILRQDETNVDILNAYAWTDRYLQKGATGRKSCRSAKNFRFSVAHAFRYPI